VADRLVGLGVIAGEDIEGTDATLAIAVERSTSRLLMTIELGYDQSHRKTDIVRAATQALRDFDPGVAVIDIVVRNQSAAQ
jgi:hypothetical protein